MPAFVNSLPKSGTHLVTKALAFLGYEDSGVSIAAMSLLGPWRLVRKIVRGCCWSGSDVVPVGIDVQVQARRRWVESQLSRIDSRAYGFGHVPFAATLKSLLARRRLTVFMAIRDPRAVIVSWAHHVSSTPRHFCYECCRDWRLPRTVEWLLEGGEVDGIRPLPFEQVRARAHGWVEIDGVHVIRFEDLVGPEGGGRSRRRVDTMSELASVVGADVKREEMDHLGDRLYGGTKTFRRGASGEWEDEVSEALKFTREARLGEYLERRGYGHSDD